MTEVTSKFNEKQFEILSEIIKSAALLGGKSYLIGTIASWGDTITDDEVLGCLKSWNEWKKSELKDRLNCADD